ncbi:hypothetical protein V3C99_015418, partial [Haemonchus contortus]
MMHEVREVSKYLATFRTEVNQRFEALERRLDRIESQLKKSDGGDSGSAKEDVRREGTEESILFKDSLRTNTNLSREPEQEREKRPR